jgi:hypothetical protein
MGRHDESRRIGEDVCKSTKRAMELFLQDLSRKPVVSQHWYELVEETWIQSVSGAGGE